MDVTVPMKPLANPAVVMVAGVVVITWPRRDVITEMTTASMTDADTA